MVAEKITDLRKQLSALSESKGGEQKSSAGDKFETSREMMRQEEELIARQLNQLERQHNDLLIAEKLTLQKAEFGSYIVTTLGNFLMTGGMGSIECNGIRITAISPASPVGQSLIGKVEKTQFTVNGNDHEIISIE